MRKAVLQYLLICYLFFFVTLLAVVGLGFLVAGLYMLLVELMQGWLATVVTGVVVLFVALLFILMCRVLAQPSPGYRASQSEESSKSAGHEADVVNSVVDLLEKSRLDVKDASVIALVAGTLLGASPELRRRLFGMGRRRRERTKPESSSGD